MARLLHLTAPRLHYCSATIELTESAELHGPFFHRYRLDDGQIVYSYDRSKHYAPVGIRTATVQLEIDVASIALELGTRAVGSKGHRSRDGHVSVRHCHRDDVVTLHRVKLHTDTVS
jgi:hypothetical protein